jgi:hypothetical protein
MNPKKPKHLSIMSSNSIPQDRTITSRDGSASQQAFSNAALLKGMLSTRNHPTIHYLYNEEQVGSQIKHTYKFYIITQGRIFNVSGIITMIFGVTVQDRSQAFSINTLPRNEDTKAFTDALKKQLDLPDLILEDLILTAEQPLEYTIAPSVLEFLPVPKRYPEKVELRS